MATKLLPHWVIVNEKTNAIWLRPFLSEEDCQYEWNKNKEIFDTEWKIEKRMSFRKVDEGEEALNRFVDKARNYKN
jgi:hypothetical protein